MKKYIYLIILMIVSFACQEDNEEPKIILKTLTEPTIKITQGEKPVENSLKDGIINLEQGKEYKIEILFKENVQLRKGKFLKMKAKNAYEFYAEFYGRNLVPIDEKIIFSKEGYKDWSLQIKQGIVIPDHYISIKASEKTKDLTLSGNINGKEVVLVDKSRYYSWYGDRYYKKDIDIIFPAPVIVDTVKDIKDETLYLIEPKKQENGQKYKLTIITAGFKKKEIVDYSIIMPFYKDNNGKKGEKLGEVIFKGDQRPYPIGGGRYTSVEKITKTNLFVFKKGGGYEGNKVYLNFEIQGRKTPIFITNINSDYFEGEAKEVDKGWYGKYWEFIVKKEKMNEVTENPIHVFDIYEGVANGVKKEGAEKREIYMEIK